MKTSRKQKFVLLVGDSFFIPVGLAASLQSHGYHVTSIGSDLAEITSGMRLKPEIILVDYEMEHTDPYAAISLLHQASPASMIVIMNGRIHRCNAEKAMSAGAEKILEREFQHPILKKTANQFDI